MSSGEYMRRNGGRSIRHHLGRVVKIIGGAILVILGGVCLIAAYGEFVDEGILGALLVAPLYLVIGVSLIAKSVEIMNAKKLGQINLIRNVIGKVDDFVANVIYDFVPSWRKEEMS